MSNAYPRRAATIRPTIAAMQAAPGPAFEQYEQPLDNGELYRFAPGSLLADDAYTTLVATGGGTAGAWLMVRRPDKGADITGSGTVYVGGKRWRRITALVADATLTLDPTNAETGDWIEFTRLDTSAHTVAFVNGGPAAGTLVTMPVSARSRVVVYFEAPDFILRASALML